MKKKLINVRLVPTVIEKLDQICLKVSKKRPKVISVLVNKQHKIMFGVDE